MDGAGVWGAGTVVFWAVLEGGATLGAAGLGWELGMEAVLGRTRFSGAGADLAAFAGGSVLALAAVFGTTGLDWEGVADRGDAVLEADGIDKDPLLRGVKLVTLEPEPGVGGAGFWACLGAFCGF